MEKQETIGELYALRAGLSVISQKKDEIFIKTKDAISALADAASLVAGKESVLFLDCFAIKFAKSPKEFQEQGIAKSECFSPAERKFICDDYRYGFYKKYSFDKLYGLYCENKKLAYGELIGYNWEKWLTVWLESWKSNDYSGFHENLQNLGRTLVPRYYNGKIINKFVIPYEKFNVNLVKKYSSDCNANSIAFPKLKELYQETEKLYLKDRGKDAKKKIPHELIRKAAFFRWLSTDECENYLKSKIYYFETYTEAEKHYFSKQKEAARQVRERVRIECIKEIHGTIAFLKQLKQVEREIMQTMQTELALVKQTGVAVNNELENTFCRTLDLRDWKYLDLIVYYFETGRADTMKEALQLVEREVQTQRIVGAIETASAQICKTIARAAAIISSQLNTISTQLSTAIAQQQAQIAQNQRLIAAADLQNALLKKANESSEQLVADVSFIKNYGVARVGK